jgi:hypothetical protein
LRGKFDTLGFAPRLRFVFLGSFARRTEIKK